MLDTCHFILFAMEGLPRGKVRSLKHWDEWGSDDEVNMSLGHTAPESSKRGRWADKSESDTEACACLPATDEGGCYDHALVDSAVDKRSAPVVRLDYCLADDAKLYESWLEDVSSLLSSYDGKLLRRYIPSLSADSFQKVVTVSGAERITYLASKKQHSRHYSAEEIASDSEQSQLQGTKEQISKMAMRRVLDITFARLASVAPDIQEVHRQWQATNDKPNRKSKASTEQHTLQWYQRGQHRFG